MARFDNVLVVGKHLVLGDMVLQNTCITGTYCAKGKLSPKWKGPYIINEELCPGTFHLAYEDEEVLE